MSVDKNKKKLDKILELTQDRAAEEVGALMGATMSMTDFSTQLISKEDFFDEPSGKLVFAEMQLTGELEGDGCILVSVRDAVRLGGTLIMLPDSELEESVSSEDYSEETEDAYGEVANIVAGAYTSTFEEMYPKSFRFVRKNLEIITPIKVDVESEKPIPNQNYYQVSSVMTLNGVEMGKLIVLIPAEPLGLDVQIQDNNEQKVDTESTGQIETSDKEADETQTETEPAGVPSSDAVEEAQSFDVKKHKKRVDACLKVSYSRLGGELEAMLGVEVKLSEHSTKLVSKEDFFFDEASGKQVLAHMDVTGKSEGKSYLFISLKDAILIGGTLIMLPEGELEKKIVAEDFNEDIEDAYGEIANIISGVYTKVFEEQYSDKIRFIKTGLEHVVPMKVDAESDEPMPDGSYYMATSLINIGGKTLGSIQFLTPVSVFQLETLGQEQTADNAPAPDAEKTRGTNNVATSGGMEHDKVALKEAGEDTQNPEFIIVSNDSEICSTITGALSANGIVSKVLDYKESVSDYLPGTVKAIFLVMATVEEQGLGVAIKISAASSLPLIAVGAEWTRMKVIKAVKYGVNDILLTPASEDEIMEKIRPGLVDKAA